MLERIPEILVKPVYEHPPVFVQRNPYIFPCVGERVFCIPKNESPPFPLYLPHVKKIQKWGERKLT